MKKDLFHYDRIHQFSTRYYHDVFLPTEVVGDEMSVKIGDVPFYFYPMKKGKTNYLLPSGFIDKLPIAVSKTKKISFRSKAYVMIDQAHSVKIVAERKMSYYDFINSWLDYEHEQPDLLIIWKIITDCAYADRINIRAISFPGWLKDSPLGVLGQLRGDCIAVNKPSYAKLKCEIAAGNKVLALNEVQDLEIKDYRSLAKYYEDTGDFKPIFINDTLGKDRIELHNHSSMTFYNFPEGTDEKIWDEIFAPKIRSRIFPILLTGGTHKITACKQTWGTVDDELSDIEYDEIKNFLRTHKWYENADNCSIEANLKPWTPKHTFKNTRWNRNYQAICKRIKLYARTEIEYHKFEEVLYQAHDQYMIYVDSKMNIIMENSVKVEERV